MGKQSPQSVKTHLPIEGARWVKNLCIHAFDLPDNKKGRWESLDEGDMPTVLLCGLTRDKELILVNLFRFPVQSFCHELPGGVIEKDEDAENAVIREFRQETGYKPATISRLCQGFLYNGKSNKKFEVWLGEGCEKVADIELDLVEQLAQLTVKVMTIGEIKDLILSGNASIDPSLAHAVLALEAKGIV